MKVTNKNGHTPYRYIRAAIVVQFSDGKEKKIGYVEDTKKGASS